MEQLKGSIKTFANLTSSESAQLRCLNWLQGTKSEKEPRVSEAPSLLLEAAETDYELSSENDLQLHTGRKPLQRDAGVMRRYAKYSFETKSK